MTEEERFHAFVQGETDEFVSDDGVVRLTSGQRKYLERAIAAEAESSDG